MPETNRETDEAEIAALARPSTAIDRRRERWFPRAGFHLARFAMLRLLGVVYAFGFLGLWEQGLPLIGEHGLTPANAYLGELAAHGLGMAEVPTVFWFGFSDAAIRGAALFGVGLSVVVACGFANAPILAVLFALLSRTRSAPGSTPRPTRCTSPACGSTISSSSSRRSSCSDRGARVARPAR